MYSFDGSILGNIRDHPIYLSLFLIVLSLTFMFSINGDKSYNMNKTVVNNTFEVNLPEGQTKPSETIIVDGSQRYYFTEKDYDMSFDCSTNESGCVPTEFNRTYLECENVYPVMPSIEENCVTTDKSVKVTLKSQRRDNHVSAPLTSVDLQVEKTSRELYGKNYEFFRNPWDLEIVNKSRFFVTGLNGQVYDVSGENTSTYNVDVKETSPSKPEKGTYTGLMGVTTHPNFSENNQIYLYYSYDSANVSGKEVTLNKVSRFKINRDKESLEKLDTIVDSIPGYMYYKGGRIKFGPSKEYLYVTTGSPVFERAQNESTLGGKILRLNPDGSIPEDNPYSNEVYAKGFRNPQGLDWNPETGNMMVSQHGPWRRDNIAKVGNGTNMGWPEPCKRSHPEAELGEEVLCTQTYTLAPSGITFVDDESHPWYNDLFIAALNGNHVHRIEFKSGKATGNEVFWFNGFQSDAYKNYGNRIRDVEYNNGNLWVLHDYSYLTKLSPN